MKRSLLVALLTITTLSAPAIAQEADEDEQDHYVETTGTEVTDPAAPTGSVTDVEWCARRRLPPDDLDVVVYRGTVDRREPTDYYVVLGAGTRRVFPTTGFDSPVDLLATFQVHRRDG